MAQNSAQSQVDADQAYLINIAALKACRNIARKKSLTDQDRLLILDAVIQIVESGYGTTPTGSRDVHDIVDATVVRFNAAPRS